MTVGPIADCHMHFYDNEYRSAPGSVLFPPNASPHMYRQQQHELGLRRTVVVQPTTYGLDNRCQLAGMAELGVEQGPDNVRGVVVIDATVTRPELEQLHGQGVRGARFHMLPGGAVGWDQLEPVAHAIADFGWHIQLQMNGRELPDRLQRLLDLPTDVVVDHVGRFMPPVRTDDPAFTALISLIETKGWVKLSAPYESSTTGPQRYQDLNPLVAALLDRVGDKAVWATNWPHPGQQSPPSTMDIAELTKRWIPNDAVRREILITNPARLYGFTKTEETSP